MKLDLSWCELKKVSLVIFSILLFFTEISAKELKEVNKETCEVCVTYMKKFIESVDEIIKGDSKTKESEIEDRFKKMCKGAKKDDNRFCYYIGGTEDAATSIIGEMTKPVSWGVPAEKVCKKLNKRDAQICELRYEKQVDLTNVNLKKLKVKDLKSILNDWEEQCRGCTEKTDFIKRIEELMPKHAPEAHKKRQEKQEL